MAKVYGIHLISLRLDAETEKKPCKSFATR